MIRTLLALLLAAFVATPSLAATLRNLDAEATRVTVTEGGVRNEIELAAGETRTVCESGCFLTFASGEMLPLTGPESVVIKDGRGRLAE